MNNRKLSLVFCIVILTGIIIVSGCAKRVSTSEIGEETKPAIKSTAETGKAVEHVAVSEPLTPMAEVVEESKLAMQEAETAPPSVKKAAGIGDAFFDFDRYSIREDAQKTLQGNAVVLKGKSFRKIVIEGHCDERGTSDYNLALGERRAESTKLYIVALGVDPSNIATISYGKEKPFCPDHNEGCWQQNRRAHFMVE
ncbi:MAG: peptidoglycan-associated lipoprotein Pal [Nitrospirae bacterium]|nr:peptidoglycan-associated lipoprotein Pal [Nitrospirota bacterium]